MADSCSTSRTEKAVVVRVKRKSTQPPVDALWLEINERPLKRPLLDFSSLSISGSSTGKEELKSKKILVKHVETVNSNEETENVLQSFMPTSANAKDLKAKLEERRNMFRQNKQKQDRLRSVAIQKHTDLVRSARFEQLWKSRKSNMENVNNPVHDLCQLYDVIRIDMDEEMPCAVQEQNDSHLEDNTILCNYMPLLREFIPAAAEAIESDLKARSSQWDGYVYDFYTVGDDSNDNDEDNFTMHPVVQVDDDDDYYDGPIHSEYESDDSNAEDNPRNDYPDEESLEDEDESRSSNDQSEDEDYYYDHSENENCMYEEESIEDEEGHDWRWDYR